MSKRRVDLSTLDHQMAQVSKQLGVTFKGGNNFYRHTGQKGEQLTVSEKDGFVLVALHGLRNMPKVITKTSPHLGVEGLADIIRRRLDSLV